MHEFGVGIDFGTTNSLVSTYDTRIKRISPLPDGNGLPHPSVVWYRPGDPPVVGREAKKHLFGFSDVPGNAFIPSIKRHLGLGKSFNIFGESRPASSIASDIFRYLKQQAERTKPDIDFSELVLTIPILFNGQARRDLRQAAEEAGIHIRRFVHEPFAAIIGYCHTENAGLDLNKIDGKLYLVFDWGGGTLDVTLVRVRDRTFEELSNNGMSNKAGDYFDEKLMKYAQRQFARMLNISENEIAPAPQDQDRLRAECERLKIKLSKSLTDNIEVARFVRHHGIDRHMNVEINRDEFSSLIQDDVNEALHCVSVTLDEAQVHSEEVDCVLLIGGSSKIPILRDEMRNRFSHRLVEVGNADSIIAEGAAIIDALEMQPTLAREIQVILSDETRYPVFKKGLPAIPEVCHQKMTFFCTDNRDGRAYLIVAESSGRVGQKHEIKTILPIPVSASLPKPFNAERVDVAFEIDNDIVLRLTGKGATQTVGNSCEVYNLCFGMSAP